MKRCAASAAKVFGRGVGRTSVSETQLQKGFPTTSDKTVPKTMPPVPIKSSTIKIDNYSLLHSKGVWGESNPPLRLSQSRVPNHYTTNTIAATPANGRDGIRTRKASSAIRLPTGSRRQTRVALPSTPTRIRTRNASFEARYDVPFHHQGVFFSVDLSGVEPESPVCRTGVFPFDHKPAFIYLISR